MTIEGIIVASLDVGVMNHAPSTVDASLDFRGSTNKRPYKWRVKPETEQVQQSIHQTYSYYYNALDYQG